MFQFKIKNLRECNRLSQSDFARRLNISQSTVGMWESGRNKPTYDMLLKLRDEFGINVGYFFDETPLELRSERTPLQASRPLTVYMPDDSMAPELQKDDELILHPVQDFADGALTAFTFKGVTYVRRIQKMPDGCLALAAGQQPALLLTRENMDDVEILGLVVELRRCFG